MLEIRENPKGKEKLIRAWCPICDNRFDFTYNQPVFCRNPLCTVMLPQIEDMINLTYERECFYLRGKKMDEPLEDW